MSVTTSTVATMRKNVQLNVVNLHYRLKMSQNSNSNLPGDDFKFIPYRKKGKKPRKTKESTVPEDLEIDNEIDETVALRRIQDAREELTSSDILSSTIASLREGFGILGNPEIKEIICLGLGHIGERIISRYQLALLLCLKNTYNTTVYVHDPIFSEAEKQILKTLGLVVLQDNKEGKYKVRSDAVTVFYLPHCPKQLTNNLLWNNWNLTLKNCVLIANSFTNIVENSTKRILTESAAYILNISPYTVELPVINTFKYFEVFNDTAIHIFPTKKLNLIPCDFWNNHLEPVYSVNELEFITNKFVNIEL